MKSFGKVIVSLMMIHATLTIIKDMQHKNWSGTFESVSAWIAEYSIAIGVVAWFVGVILLKMVLIRREHERYLKMPTAYEYARNNPYQKSGQGYSCNRCGSRSIRNWGVSSAYDSDRVFICNHCNAHLYRN